MNNSDATAFLNEARQIVTATIQHVKWPIDDNFERAAHLHVEKRITSALKKGGTRPSEIAIARCKTALGNAAIAMWDQWKEARVSGAFPIRPDSPSERGVPNGTLCT